MKYIRNVVWSLSPNTVVKNSKIFRNNVKNSIFKNYFLTESSYLPAYEKDWFWGNIIYTYYFLFHFSIFFSPLCVALMLLIHEFIHTLENKKKRSLDSRSWINFHKTLIHSTQILTKSFKVKMLLLIKKKPVNSLIALSKLGQIATVIRIEDTEIFFSLPFQKIYFL